MASIRHDIPLVDLLLDAFLQNYLPCILATVSNILQLLLEAGLFFSLSRTHLLRPIAIPIVPNGSNHTSAFTKAAATLEAHNATLNVSKALAHTGIRTLLDDHFFGEVSWCREPPLCT
jgi:hypothetical protein